jgi:hypothetical protein
MQKSRELTPSELRWLRHIRRALEQGVTLVDYARSAGVKVGSLYEARHSIARKGVELPSETLAPIDLGVRMANVDLCLEQTVSEPLMIALGVTCFDP